MPPTTPYSADLGGREPFASIREATARIRTITSAWAEPQFAKSYAAGKWNARELLTHLAQTELALGNRARMALTVPNYAAQPFDQDKWVAREPRLSGRDATESFLALARMNLTLFEGLSPEDLAITCRHPEYGDISVDWILHTIAGHQRHHLAQLETIARTVGTA
jgi:hypothetical protein